MRQFFILLFVVVLVGGSAWGLLAQSLDPVAIKEPTPTPEINRGKMSYQAFCQECHGVNGAGTDKGPTFLHKFYRPGHHGDQSFYMAAKNGVKAHHWKFGDMPPVDGVNETQVKNIIAYVRAIQQANGL